MEWMNIKKVGVIAFGGPDTNCLVMSYLHLANIVGNMFDPLEIVQFSGNPNYISNNVY